MTAVARISAWLEERTGIPGRMRAFLDKPLPANVSWLHTLGALLLVYLGMQALTGILIGLYYSPSPGSAYESLSYVRNELVLGRFVLALHKHGAAFVLVTAALHLLRAYLTAAYRPPRELLWWTGLALFLLLTLFAFTGQLLPFDQHGYWATKVGIRIASGVPFGSKIVEALLTGGYGDIGSVTLSRFYVLHVCVLPLLLAALIALHLGILQRVGPAGALPPAGRAARTFFPGQALKDLTVTAAGALLLFAVAWLLPPAGTGPADPGAAGFTPRPEWYFFAHFELLRYLPSGWQILGTFVLPLGLGALLFVLPLADPRAGRPLRERLRIGAGLAGAFVVAGLTAAGIYAEATEKKPLEALVGDPIAAGRRIFEERKCIKCHTIDGKGGDKGPDLSHVARRIRSDYFTPWIRRPQDLDPDTEMPAFEGSDAELRVLVRYLRSLK